jgi:hypothetical protein
MRGETAIHRTIRRAAVLGTALIGTGILLAGCSLLNPGAPRDADGNVTEATTISARDLLDGDCFTFNSTDGSVVAEVTVMPCEEQHDYLVIQQGTLSAADVADAGTLQNAVSAACADTFQAFKEAVVSDTRPKQEFLVFAESDEPDADHVYSCIATDPDQTVSESAPEE